MPTVSQALSLSDILYPIEAPMAALTEFMHNQVGCFEPEIRPMIEYVLAHNGKRLRPICVFYAGLGGDWSKQVKAAAVVECIHLATLVHDDVLDGATLRHQMPTLNREIGTHDAVLIGDALFAHALVLASEFETPFVCQMAAQATRRLCAGEISQSLSHHQKRLSIQHYERVINLKTAELFSAACSLGSYIKCADADEQRALALYGRNLGMAYQLYDDMVDLMGTESVFGKTLGTDLKTHKYTLPVLLFLDSLTETARDIWLKRFQEPDFDTVELVALLRDSGICSHLVDRMSDHISQAEAAVRHLPNSQALQMLSAFFRQTTQAVARLV